MKKKILIIIGITAFIVVAMFVGRGISNNIKNKKEEQEIADIIKPNIEKLSEEARKNLNYDELIADIKAVKNGKKLVYAKLETESNVDNGDMTRSRKYVGEGYYYLSDFTMLIDAGISNGYFKSSNGDVELYSKNKMIDMSARQYNPYEEETIDKLKQNIFTEIVILVVLVGAISCIIVYVKEKKKQNN